MPFTYVLEGAALAVPMAILIFLVLRWVKNQPNLLQELNPQTGNMGPPHICRGGWNEGEMRGCGSGYATTGIPVEPVNTYSNLAYLIAGWVALRFHGGGVAPIFLLAMAFLCFGSALYHGVKTRWSARWDHGGIYAVFGGLAFYLVAKGHPGEFWFVLAGTALCGAVLAWILDGHLMARVGLLLALILVGVLNMGNAIEAGNSMIFFGLAFAAWLVDVHTGVLDRFGHGIWHVLTAVALVIMFGAI